MELYELAKNIKCTMDMETYFVMGVEIEQDDLIVALADEFDVPSIRGDIEDFKLEIAS